MKNHTIFILFFLFLLFSQSLFSQSVVISNDALNVLFANFENTLQFAVEGVSYSELEAKVDVGKVEKIKDSFFKITTPNQGKVTVTLFKKGEKVGEKVFRIKKMPTPDRRVGLWATFSAGCGTSYPETYEIFAESNYGKCDVTEFELTIIFPDNTQKVYQVKSSKMTEEIIALMKNRKAGTTYFFEKIKAKCEKCSDVFDLASAVIVIRN